jgi:hypothetical protein
MKTNIPVIGRYCQCEKGEKEVGADDQGRIPYLFFLHSLPISTILYRGHGTENMGKHAWIFTISVKQCQKRKPKKY